MESHNDYNTNNYYPVPFLQVTSVERFEGPAKQ